MLHSELQNLNHLILWLEKWQLVVNGNHLGQTRNQTLYDVEYGYWPNAGITVY